MIGAVLGGIIGQLIPFDLEGIDFCMTALFVIIFIDRWEKSNNHFPAIARIIVSVICLIIFGETLFMLPSLIILCREYLCLGTVYRRKSHERNSYHNTYFCGNYFSDKSFTVYILQREQANARKSQKAWGSSAICDNGGGNNLQMET